MKSNQTKSALFTRLIFSFVLGLLIQDLMPVRSVDVWLPMIFLFLFFIVFQNIPFTRFYGMFWIAGLIVHLLTFSFGRLVRYISRDIQIEQTACYSPLSKNTLIIRILSEPVRKSASFKCQGEICWLVKESACYVQSEKILLYFNIKTDSASLRKGSLIVTRNKLIPIENSPAIAFDYKRYCRLRHVYAQIFLRPYQFDFLSNGMEQTFSSPLDLLRKKILALIRTQIDQKKEYGFLEALLIGYSSDLESDLMKSYANTGVIHIIAISGLHLALIFKILEIGFGGFKKKSGRWIKFLLIMIVIGGYSLLTGASASIVRSAVMFSLMLFAKCINRETQAFNILSASAFLLLCYDPFWIWDAGFQLSYGAVLSLLLFSKPVYSIICVKNKLLDILWNASSVSIAAQILVTPIYIYYFHQFPIYFLFANLLAVPLSSAILTGGIILCFHTFFFPEMHYPGWILNWMIRLLNDFVKYLSGLPGAVISDITLNLPQLFGMYGIIYCVYRLWILKTPALPAYPITLILRLLRRVHHKKTFI